MSAGTKLMKMPTTWVTIDHVFSSTGFMGWPVDDAYGFAGGGGVVDMRQLKHEGRERYTPGPRAFTLVN